MPRPRHIVAWWARLLAFVLVPLVLAGLSSCTSGPEVDLEWDVEDGRF